MGFLRVLFWCAAVARSILRCNSRFGVFNSRLAANEFPFGLQRELPGKRLIRFAIFGAGAALFGNNPENSRFHGNNRVSRSPTKRGWRDRHPGRNTGQVFPHQALGA
jgi:hypothetical protein